MTTSSISLQFGTGMLIHMAGSFFRSRKNSLEKLFAHYANCDQATIIFSQDHGSLFSAPILPKPLYGLRVSEATLLKLSHIDFEKKRIFIHRLKGGVSGERPLFRIAERLLRRCLDARLETGDGLFTGRQGNLKRQRIYQLFKGYAREAGLDVRYSVHSLRHSIATHLLEAGEGIEFVRDHLGHRSIQNTMIYAQITDRGREEAFRRVERSSKIARV